MNHRTSNKIRGTRHEEQKHLSCSFSFLVSRSSAAGFTLFYAVLVSSLLLALGLAIFNITYKELILSSGARESATAFYAADAGLECALFWDRKHTGLSSPVFGFYGDSLASGLEAYWRFEEGSGDTARDSSGKGNDGELTNMDPALAWTGGHTGDGLAFDGIDDYVLAPDLDYTDEMTGSLWVRFTAVANQQMLVSQSNNIEVQMQMEGAAGSSKFRIRVDSAGGSDVVNSTTMATAGIWYHVAWTYDGINTKLYINGNEETNSIQNSGTGSIADRNEGYGIGARNNAALPTGGLIDDVRIYNRVLSEDEIEKIAEGESNIKFTDPVNDLSGATCLGLDITDPANGWEVIATSTVGAHTTFGIEFATGRCAIVDIQKDTSTTTIVSRGYNTCNPDNPRRVERAIRAIY